MKVNIKRRLIVACVAVFTICICLLYFFADPSATPMFPQCPFFMATGFKCPGCGSQRAFHSLLHGDVETAWHFNAMLVLFLPFLVALLMAELFKGRYPLLYSKLNSSGTALVCAVALLAWWIIRN